MIQLLPSDTNVNCYILEKGLRGWIKSGGDYIRHKDEPIPIMRQVQITAGLLVLIGIILGFSVSIYFTLLSAFIGAGLVFAGLSGWCGMAKVLMLLPYNKKSQ